MNAIRWDLASLDGAAVLIAFAWNFFAQSTLLLLAGFLAARIWSRLGSSAQSTIYRATLIAVLVCPLLSAAFSGLGIFGANLSIPSVWTPLDEAPNPRQETNFTRTTGTVDPQPRRPERLQGEPEGTVPFAGQAPVGSEGQAKNSPLQLGVESQAVDEASNAIVPGTSASIFGRVALAACAAWMAGTACLLIRLARAWRQLARIRNSAIAADDETMRACKELAARLHVAPVPVLKSPFLPGPCLAGSFQPVILLPEWDQHSAMRDILVHELAHLRRGDGLWNLLRHLATAVFCFQPLLWQLSRKLEVTAEEVCDDWVVELGNDRQAYAHTLADVAQWSVAPLGAVGVAMASEHSLLTQRVMRILDPSRPLSTGIGRGLFLGIVAAASLGTLGMGWAGAKPATDEKANQPSAKSENSAATQEEGNSKPSIEKMGDSVIVRGLVRTPDGKPASGAKVTLRHWEGSSAGESSTMATTMTENDGKFTVRYRRTSIDPKKHAEPERFDITAQAPGFGMQWASSDEFEATQPLVLALLPEVPIHGRIVDIQGKPIPAVQVSVAVVGCRNQAGDLTPWIDVVRAGGDDNAAHRKLDRALHEVQKLREAPALTDPSGRFILTGIGPECVVDLNIKGDAIAFQRVSVATRKMEPLTRILWPHSGLHKPPIQDRVFGSDFTYTAVPTRILEGTIRDAKTRQPLPHVVIKSEHLASMHVGPSGQGAVHTRSDAQGRYRLIGLPQGNGPEIADLNEIWLIPGGEAPYFKRAIRIPAAKGDGPQTLDIEMHRGLWIHGRVTEKGTGKPVQARISYLPWRFNPHVRDLPEFHEDTSVVGFEGLTCLTDREGRYRLPGLSGQGMVTAWSIQGSYLRDIGSDDVPGRDKAGFYPTIGSSSHAVETEQFHAVKAIDPNDGVLETSCDFVLDPGETLQLAITDQKGQPVPGCTIVADRRSVGFPTSIAAVLDIANLVPGKPTDIAIVHRERKLGKFVTLNWKQDGPRTVSVTLEPCATIKGKVVDEQGKPFKILEFVVSPSEEIRVHLGYPMAYTNADGTFEYAHAPVGCKDYSISVIGAEIQGTVAEVAKNVEIQAGKTIDVGVVKIKRKK